MEKQRKNWMNRYSTLIGLLIVLAILLLLIIKPLDNSSQFISIDKTIQKSDKCPSDISSFASSTDTINYKQINKNPELYTRRLAKFTGYVNQIQEMNGKGIIYLQLQKENVFSPDDVISIYYVGHTDVVENDIITVYGFIRGAGTFTFGTNKPIIIPNITSCKMVDVVKSGMQK